jgi:xylulose-5-phosphate/fructose-6-phosphate phosphoketolase
LMDEKRAAHSAYIREHGEDMPEVAGWRWEKPTGDVVGSTEGDNV